MDAALQIPGLANTETENRTLSRQKLAKISISCSKSSPQTGSINSSPTLATSAGIVILIPHISRYLVTMETMTGLLEQAKFLKQLLDTNSIDQASYDRKVDELMMIKARRPAHRAL